MERRALVIDANILIRAVLGQRVRRMLAKSAPDANRAVPLSMSLFAPPPMTDDRRFAASRTVAWKPLPVDFIRLGVAFRVFSWDNYNHLGAKARSRRPAKDCSAQAFAPSYQIRQKKEQDLLRQPRSSTLAGAARSRCSRNSPDTHLIPTIRPPWAGSSPAIEDPHPCSARASEK